MSENPQEYVIARDGDDIEQVYWNRIGPFFGNYQVFWQKFVCPATNRPNNIYPRRDVAWPLERVCITHYPVFYHLSRAWLYRDKQRYMENFFIHLTRTSRNQKG